MVSLDANFGGNGSHCQHGGYSNLLDGLSKVS